MAEIVILTGTDPTSCRGGIGFALPGYLRALGEAGLHWVLIPTYHPAIPGGKWRLWLAAFPRLVREILAARKAGGVAVVYSHAGSGLSLMREFFILACARVLGAATIMQLHAHEVDGYLEQPMKRWMFCLAIAPAQGLGVLTLWWKRCLSGAGIRKPLYVIPNPLPAEWEALARKPRQVGSSTDKIMLLSVTRLVPGKGVEYVIEAMPYLPVEFELIVAGDGSLQEQLIRRVEGLGVNGRVRFVGWVTGDEKQRLFDESDVFVLPSRYDSFGMGFLEAMANGLPVVAAEWGPIPDVVPHGRCGVLVRGEETQDLVAAILSLRDADTRRRMGEEAKRWVRERFSAAVVGKEIAGAVQALVK